jgi:hypothetical protein
VNGAKSAAARTADVFDIAALVLIIHLHVLFSELKAAKSVRFVLNVVE